MTERSEHWVSRARPSDEFDDFPDQRSKSIAILVLAVILVGAIVFLIVGGSPDDESGSPPTSLDSEAIVAPPDEDTAAGTSSTPLEPLPDSPAATGPYVHAVLDENRFVLSGLVPSPELAGLLLQAAEVAYSPYIRSELMVDESLDSVGWLSNSPQAIVLLPTITDGSILIADGTVQVSGRAPTSTSVTQLTEALGTATELPVVVSEVQVTNLDEPVYVIAAVDGRVELSGVVPSEEIRGLLVDGAIGAYGPGNVLDKLEVDAGVYSSLWMYNGGPLLQAMSVFPEYELRIDGTAFSGFIRGGVTFEPGSAVFTADYATVLDVGVSVLTRDQSLDLVIEGHTDSDGSDSVNLLLSQQRADAVMAYFVDNGIDGDRLSAIGLGESAPVVPNDTLEGRARNRRIEFKLLPKTG